MPRQIVKTAGIVLRVRRMGDTSKLVTLYTEDCGKLKVVAKGARRPRSKYGAALDVLNVVSIVCYVRPERELQTLSDAELVCSHHGLAHDLERLACGSGACELVDQLTIEGESNRRLYRCLEGVLNGLEEVRAEQVEALFWYYELRVAEALGYQPELSRCVACRRALTGPWLWFSAAQGGGMCPACGSGIRVAGQSLGFLAQLQGLRSYTREAIPPAPARRHDLREALRSFLEYHGGRGGALRSLRFLEAVSHPAGASATSTAGGASRGTVVQGLDQDDRSSR